MSLPTSTADRPLGLQCRSDLSFAPSVGGGQIVSDTIQAVHHELTLEEVALLEMLGSSQQKSPSLRQLQAMYQKQFAPRRISIEELGHRIGLLHEAGLLVASKAGQGDAFWQRHETKRQSERRWAWTQLLSIRLPGINPAPLLSRFNGLGHLLFSPVGSVVAGLLWVIGLVVLLGSASSFYAELPGPSDFSSPTNWIGLLLGVAVLKSFHELGHALACHRCGAQVREMGILFLMFMPCLYSDVTDAWRLPRRGQRLLITSAGMLVEITIAAVALLVWRFSEPGWIHQAAHATVLIASIGTLLVNLNPLMRYDGYYLLSDLTETPNLWTRSRQAIADYANGWFFRKEVDKQRSEPFWIAAYGIASQAFIYLLLGGFLWLLIAVTRHQRFEVVGWAVAALVLAGMVAPKVSTVIGAMRRPNRKRSLRKLPAAGFAMLLLVVSAGVLTLPCPKRIAAPVVLVPAELEMISASLSGRLVEMLPVGTRVQAGDLIARFENPEMERRLLAVNAELAACELDVQLIHSQRVIDPAIASQLPTAKARLKSCKERLAGLELEYSRLSLYASISGVLLPVEVDGLTEISQAETSDQQLPRWTKCLLDPTCQGAWVEVGTVVAQVAKTEGIEAELLVADSRSNRLVLGQNVRIALGQSTTGLLQGEVVEIGRRSTPQTIESTSKFAWAADWLPASNATFRRVRVRFASLDKEATSKNYTLGGLGEARIDTGTQTLWQQAVESFNATFKLP